MIEMNRGVAPYKNSHVEYVKNLFKDVPKAKGKLVHVSNGGYNTLEPIAFGCRIYFDSKDGIYNCQVYSDAREKCGKELIREYSVPQECLCDSLVRNRIYGEDTSLETVLNAIFYNEYVDRTWLRKLEMKEKEKINYE